MDRPSIGEIIRRKPALFLLLSLGYLILTGFLKWNIHPSIGTAFFFAGGLLGVYFLDIAEVFFRLNPSPFRTIVFTGAFVFMSLFIVTSSDSMTARGLVLSLYLTLIMWQIGQWEYEGNLASWYRMVAGPVPVAAQRWGLVILVAVFFIETFLFIRQ